MTPCCLALIIVATVIGTLAVLVIAGLIKKSREEKNRPEGTEIRRVK